MQRNIASVTRRHFMRTSLSDFLFCCAALPILSSASAERTPKGSSRLNWDSFIDQLESAARQQHYAAWNHDKYVSDVMALATRLDLSEPIFSRAQAAYRDLHPLYPEFTDLFHTADVQVSLISFEMDEIIPHHDHPGMTGVMTCVAGSVGVKEYDVVDNLGNSGVLLKLAGSRLLRPGQTSALTPRSRNVHAVKASAFTQIIDIFTPAYNDELRRRTQWLDIGPNPLDNKGETFIAHAAMK